MSPKYEKVAVVTRAPRPRYQAMSEQIIYRNNPLGAPAVGDRADEGLTCLSYETKYLGDSTLATVKKKSERGVGEGSPTSDTELE